VARRKAKEAEHDDSERWLLTYADMMTLMVALFIVLFSISSVNKSKFETVQKALKDAFSGRVLPGGKGIAEAGGPSTSTKAIAPPIANLPDPMVEATTGRTHLTSRAAKAEEADFEALKRKIDAYARTHGLSGKVSTRITPDGLAIRLLTDKLLFDSGSAATKPEATALLGRLGGLLHSERTHPVRVEGHTDAVPIHSPQFPTNWELSTARASAVVRVLAADGVSPSRLTAAGRADLDPIAPETSAAARALNRRVEILLPRQAMEGRTR
jgi:chemotaxis protein MotB